MRCFNPPGQGAHVVRPCPQVIYRSVRLGLFVESSGTAAIAVAPTGDKQKGKSYRLHVKATFLRPRQFFQACSPATCGAARPDRGANGRL